MAQVQESPITDENDADTDALVVEPRRRRGVLVWLPPVVVLALVAVLAVAVLRPAAADPLSAHNQPATDFSMALYNGYNGSRTINTRSLRGKTLVVNFWWANCQPCQQEAPLLEQAWRRWKDKNVVFIGVDGQDASVPADFLRTYHITYPNGKDPNYVNIEYGATGFPETVFISPRGMWTDKYAQPFPDAATLDALIRKARA